MVADQIRVDSEQLASFGYRQQLTRALGLWSNFSLGFTYLSPVVGVYTLFAFGLAKAGPAFIWTIPLVVAGQFLVVLTFGEVASQYPIAGGIYQWCKHLVGDKFAWFAGWFYAWALLVTIAAVAFGAAGYVIVTPSTTALALVTVIAFTAAVPATTWIVVVVLASVSSSWTASVTETLLPVGVKVNVGLWSVPAVNVAPTTVQV